MPERLKAFPFTLPLKITRPNSGAPDTRVNVIVVRCARPVGSVTVPAKSNPAMSAHDFELDVSAICLHAAITPPVARTHVHTTLRYKMSNFKEAPSGNTCVFAAAHAPSDMRKQRVKLQPCWITVAAAFSLAESFLLEVMSSLTRASS